MTTSRIKLTIKLVAGLIIESIIGLMTGVITELSTEIVTGLTTGTVTGLTTGTVTGLTTGAITGLTIGIVTGLTTGTFTGLTTGMTTGSKTGPSVLYLAAAYLALEELVQLRYCLFSYTVTCQAVTLFFQLRNWLSNCGVACLTAKLLFCQAVEILISSCLTILHNLFLSGDTCTNSRTFLPPIVSLNKTNQARQTK